LIAYARRRLAAQLSGRGASDAEVLDARSALHSEILTIGFARRFATYKRATLLLHDKLRLKQLLLRQEQPVQFLISGKSHPRDNAGKELIREIIHFASDPEVRQRIVFLEDYDMAVARYIVQGVDVWLNTPRRPNEASGTSGMKVVANGGLNLSILDGWWSEAYDPYVGWAIGNGEEYEDHGYQDRVECDALYNLLENDIIPLFYNRGAGGLPRAWIAKMKASMKKLCPLYNANRVVAAYTKNFYIPAAERFERLKEDNGRRARLLVDWRSKMRELWNEIRIEKVDRQAEEDLQVGATLHVSAQIKLGEISPGEVLVQIFRGRLDSTQQIQEGEPFPMALESSIGDGCHTFSVDIPCDKSGMCGFSIRVLPYHEEALLPKELPLITWAE
jgi:starch phosphorylase